MRKTRSSKNKPIQQQPSLELDTVSDGSDCTFVGEEVVPQPRAYKRDKQSKCPSIDLSEFDLDEMSCSYNINCKTGKKGNDKARSYYPSFTRDNLRLMFYHLTATFLFYMMIFPMVNFVFTYCTNTDIKVLELFGHVTSSPTNTSGLWKHFVLLKWLKFPAVTAESVSLFVAIALKDTISLHWEELSRDYSIRDIICMNIAKKYN